MTIGSISYVYTIHGLKKIKKHHVLFIIILTFPKLEISTFGISGSK